ncbi:hypothetical protein AV530_000181 [Patagioenas fasciata monilis]|uniref:Uncharacterized protein n=1 Tax=Patagioenas fasciata monilis TaxID=372326 RepID=A0A1V4K9H3_PATFA|nr:hypothetical protein AV530_000181 [Patagioenas fasciata monilis]
MEKLSVFSIVRTRGRDAAQTWAQPLRSHTPSPHRDPARFGLAWKRFKLVAILAKKAMGCSLSIAAAVLSHYGTSAQAADSCGSAACAK